jgi:PAP_fibrillin
MRHHNICRSFFRLQDDRYSIQTMIALFQCILVLIIPSSHAFLIHSGYQTIPKTTTVTLSSTKLFVQTPLSSDQTNSDTIIVPTSNLTSNEDDNPNPRTEGKDDDMFFTKDSSSTNASLESKHTTTMSSTSITKNILFLTSLGAITGRGEYATTTQKESAEQVIRTLEQNNPIPDPCRSEHMIGTWEVLYCSTELFRSSPFFMAGRAVCQTEEQRQQYDFFCTMHRKALAISNIGTVRQIISDQQLISEFEVKVGAIPFLSDFTPFRYSGGMPITINGAIVSTADITSTYSNEWELYMDTVEIKGSNVPLLRQLLDTNRFQLQSRSLGKLLEDNKASIGSIVSSLSNYQTPRPRFRTTYLDDMIRINRDQDDNIFVYIKTSNATQPTNYKSVDSDLGIGTLLESFNDAITKIYL